MVLSNKITRNSEKKLYGLHMQSQSLCSTSTLHIKIYLSASSKLSNGTKIKGDLFKGVFFVKNTYLFIKILNTYFFKSFLNI